MPIALLLLALLATTTASLAAGEESSIVERELDPSWKEDPYRPRRFWDRGASADEYQWALRATGQWPRSAEEPPSIAGSPWTRLGPVGNVSLQNGRIAGIHLRSDGSGSHLVYAGACNGGLWVARAVDGVGHWTSLGDNLPNPSVRAFAVNPTNPGRIIVGTGDYLRARGGGMFQTANGGASWTQIPISPTPDSFFRIHFLPSNPNVLLAASDQGILRSTDGGNTWTTRLSGFASDLIFHPTNANLQFACSHSGGRGVFKSTDAGVTWTRIVHAVLPDSGDFGRASIAICRDFPLHMALLVEGGFNLQGVYRTTNGGTTWTNITNNLAGFGDGQIWHAQAIAYRPNDSNQIYVGAVDIAHTTNGGTTWLVGGGAAGISIGHADITQLHFSSFTGDSVLWITNDGGIYRHVIGGATTSWNGNSVDGLVCSQIDHLSANRQFRMLGLQDNGTMRSTSAGASWSLVQSGDGGDNEFTDPEAFHSWFADGVYDPPRTWRTYKYLNGTQPLDTNNPATYSPALFHDRFTGTMWSHGSSTIVSSPTAGTPSWSSLVSLVSPIASIRGSYSDGKTILVRYYNPNDRRLTILENTGSWTQRTITLPDNSNTFAAAVVSTEWPAENWAGLEGVGGQKVLYTKNRWQTWTDVTGSLSAVREVSSIVATPFNLRQLFAATDIGVFWTQDGGATWAPFQDGLPIVRCTEIRYLVDPLHGGADRLVVATHGRGMWERVIAGPPIFYVDRRNLGLENGTFEHPYNTFGEGVAAASAGAVVGLRGDIYTEPLVLTAPRVYMAYETHSELQ